MRVLTLVFGLLTFASAAYSQEEGDRKSAIPEEALKYVEPVRMVLIEALSRSGATPNDTTHDMDTIYVSLSDFENSPYNPSFNPPQWDAPPSFFDSIRFERIVFLPWTRKPRVRQTSYAAFRYLGGSTLDSMRIYAEWKYIPGDAARWNTNPSAALVTVVRRGDAWEIVDWRRLRTK